MRFDARAPFDKLRASFETADRFPEMREHTAIRLYGSAG